MVGVPAAAAVAAVVVVVGHGVVVVVAGGAVVLVVEVLVEGVDEEVVDEVVDVVDVEVVDVEVDEVGEQLVLASTVRMYCTVWPSLPLATMECWPAAVSAGTVNVNVNVPSEPTAAVPRPTGELCRTKVTTTPEVQPLPVSVTEAPGCAVTDPTVWSVVLVDGVVVDVLVLLVEVDDVDDVEVEEVEVDDVDVEDVDVVVPGTVVVVVPWAMVVVVEVVVVVGSAAKLMSTNVCV